MRENFEKLFYMGNGIYMKIIFVGSEVALCLGAGARVRARSILVVFPLCRRKCSSCFSMVAIYLEELW